MMSRSWLTMLMHIDHPDEDMQRRGRNIILIALGLIGLAVLTTINSVVTGFTSAALIATAGSAFCFIMALLLARRGTVTLAAVLLTGISIVALIGSAVFGPIASAISPFYFLLPLLIASATMPPRAIWVILGACLLSLLVMERVSLRLPLAELSYDQATIHGALLAMFAALIGALNAGGMLRILRVAQAARQSAEQAAAALTAANHTLEERIAVRTTALAESLAAQQAQATQLQVALTTQRQLNDVVAKLSLPIIPVRQDTLIVPFIGAIDSRRVEELLSHVLRAIETQHARVILLDVTGVPIIDSHAGQALLKTARAAALLGARTILVGIRPEVAQTLVSVGIDVHAIETHATLQQGLEQLDRQRRSTVRS